MREVARLFREKRIPADVLYLDIDYLDGFRPFTINREYFPHFEEMIADLHGQGFKFISIIDPHLKKQEGYSPTTRASPATTLSRTRMARSTWAWCGRARASFLNSPWSGPASGGAHSSKS